MPVSALTQEDALGVKPGLVPVCWERVCCTECNECLGLADPAVAGDSAVQGQSNSKDGVPFKCHVYGATEGSRLKTIPLLCTEFKSVIMAPFKTLPPKSSPEGGMVWEKAERIMDNIL